MFDYNEDTGNYGAQCLACCLIGLAILAVAGCALIGAIGYFVWQMAA